MSKPKDLEKYDTQLRLMEVTEDPFYIEENNSKPVPCISMDQFGNEWDDTSDFADMDFRLVDDEDIEYSH